jgi:hypothetical protein
MWRNSLCLFVFFQSKFSLSIEIEPAKRGRKTGDVKNGTKTLRFKADGRASIEETNGIMDKAIERINGLLETYMGINDADLGKLNQSPIAMILFFFFSTTNLGFSRE